jgi:hypothetical protein
MREIDVSAASARHSRVRSSTVIDELIGGELDEALACPR